MEDSKAADERRIAELIHAVARVCMTARRLMRIEPCLQLEAQLKQSSEDVAALTEELISKTQVCPSHACCSVHRWHLLQSKDELFHKAEQLNQAVRSTELRWEDDDNAAACRGCRTEFSLLNRKHHCRSCGRIFCGAQAFVTAPLHHPRHLLRPLRGPARVRQARTPL